MSALLLLGPWTPLLFQGQEWGSRQPFSYFCDHAPDLQAAVFQGRQAFLSQFTRLREAYEGATVDADRTAGLRGVPARPRLRSAGRSDLADVSGSDNAAP